METQTKKPMETELQKVTRRVFVGLAMKEAEARGVRCTGDFLRAKYFDLMAALRGVLVEYRGGDGREPFATIALRRQGELEGHCRRLQRMMEDHEAKLDAANTSLQAAAEAVNALAANALPMFHALKQPIIEEMADIRNFIRDAKKLPNDGEAEILYAMEARKGGAH